MGSVRYPDATNLYITADGGGSNSSKSRLWKTELQELADELLLPIEVSHFPPGASKSGTRLSTDYSALLLRIGEVNLLRPMRLFLASSVQQRRKQVW